MKIYAFADEASSLIDNQIIAMKRNGLQGLEIRNVDGTNVSEISTHKAKEVKAKLDANGLCVWSIGSPIGKTTIGIDNFTQQLELLRHTCEVANVMDSKNIRMFSFYYPKTDSADTHRNEVIDRIGKMLDVAKEHGITLCHENEKGIYGDIAVRCLDLHKTFPELKCVFDPANYVQSSQDTVEAYEMLKDYVYYLHIKDALQDGNVVPAGQGVGNLPYILKEYTKRGGNAVTIEPHLKVFSGLEALEQAGEESKIGIKAYGSGDEAFDAACEALKGIL